MQLRLKRMHLRIDWLMLLFPIVAVCLGEGEAVAVLLFSLSVHEAAHYLAARALGISFRSLRLTPFGCLSEIENPYAVTAPCLCAVSIAGPAANLLTLLCAAALCHWQMLNASAAAEIISVNAVLMMFNLLPALPLDGGRILYAVLSTFLPRRRAVETGILFGRILSAVLILTALWGLVFHRVLNLSPILAAIFLIGSARDERHALMNSQILSLMDSIKPVRVPVPASIIAIDANTPPEIALRSASPGKITLFAVFRDGHFNRLVDDRTLIMRLAADSAENQKNIHKK